MAAPASVLNLPDETRMLDVVRSGLERAQDVLIAVSFTKCSGLALLIDPLREVAQRGGDIRLLTSTYQCVTQPEALEVLRGLPRVQTRVQSGPTGFHAKFWWFHGTSGAECWAGSSNLSKGGLSDNIEWNVRGIEPAILEVTRRQFDLLWNRDDVIDPDDEFMRQYRVAYRARMLQQDASATKWEPHLQVADAPRVVVPNAAQEEALAALARLRERGETRAAVIAAPGIGKTFLAAFDVRNSGARSALYVSHRLEHLIQARRTFQTVLPSISTGIVGGGFDEPEAQMVFATIGSLTSRPELCGRDFDYLVIDEFHHAEAPSYLALRPIRDRAFLLGITATPERQDGHDVLEWCDWNVAYEVRIPEAIDRGWLLPFHYFGIADETVDFPWHRLDPEELGDILSVEARAEHVLRHALERGFDGARRATVGFCSSRKHARFMADAFNRRGENAEVVLGDAPVLERQAVYERLANPRDPLEWIFVADVLNEGVDIPEINSVLFLRPTESATLFLQQLGRGLRLCPGSEVLTVLDFVGHHRSAWLTLNTLDAPSGGGRRTEIAEGVVIKPPRSCEVVLERRTREILAKIERFRTRREECEEAYVRVRSELERPPMPVDLWNRTDVPELARFRAAYGGWVNCQRENGNEPMWAQGLAPDHAVFAFLRAVEADWQAQRVSPYALVWGLSANPEDPELGYENFFIQWPQWKGERSELDGSKTWDTVRRKLAGALSGDRLSPDIQKALGAQLRDEVEKRILYTVNRDHQERHGGVLRMPSDLNLFAKYNRPDIVRHFGVHYDPAKHNAGILWFGNEGVVTTKLDTSGAKEEHQYENRFADQRTFHWTSQNRMAPDNEAGRKVIEHEERGHRIHLFVQPRSKELACYLGTARVAGTNGSKPMAITFELDHAIPTDLRRELEGATLGDALEGS